MLEFSRLFLYFFIYAFLGWCCEVIYCSIIQRKLVNRGFLHIPVCPIYGLGAVAVILGLTPFIKYPLLVLACGFVITSLVEYVVSLVLERIFNMRWWDYSKHKFNINGRVCLLNSTMFAVLVMALLYGIHPLLEDFVLKIDERIIYVLAISLEIITIADSVFTTFKLINFVDYVRNLVEKIEVKYKKRFDMFQKRFPNMSLRKKEEGKRILVRVKEYFSNIFENRNK